MRRFRHETILYVLAFLLALFVRLVELGRAPLTDAEARWALQALGVAQGARPVLGSQPAYVLLTAVLFYLLGAGTSFLARLVPALAGSALAFTPALFERWLKPRAAVILAFLLALEPGLVALSRQAGSGMLAISFALLAWGLWHRRRAAAAGIFAGLALMSGPMLWEGLLGLALTWLILRLVERREPAEAEAEAGAEDMAAPAPWRTALWFALGTVLLFGTLFFLAPNGLSAWVSGLPDYFGGWVRSSGLSAGLLLFSLAAYQPLGVVLGVLATLRGWLRSSRRIIRLGVWALVALLLALFYPAHEVSDLAWMLIPLWALAALELARALNLHREERVEVLGVVGLTVIILVFIWINFLALLQAGVASEQTTLRSWLLFGSFLLLLISILLVAVGWSARSARYGAVLGVTAALGVYGIAAMAGAAGLRAIPDATELWAAGSSLPQASLLQSTVDQASDLSETNANAQPVTIAGIDSPALQWLLRSHPVSVVTALDASTTPPIVITQAQDNPALDAHYRGQEFVWRQDPQWTQTGLTDWLGWLGFHQVIQNPQRVIVWVRGDLFIDSAKPNP